MTTAPSTCGNPHRQQCALLLRRSVIEGTGWTATGPVLAVGARAAGLARLLAERHSPALLLAATDTDSDTDRSGQAQHTTTLAGDPLLLPTLGLPALSLAFVSNHPPAEAPQLLLDLDVLLRPGAVVVFVPTWRASDLLPYAEPARMSAFHQLQAVRLDHVRCTGRLRPQSTAVSSHHGVTALVATRPAGAGRS
ncbi:hypothetical protein ACIRBX_22525 [Kitasatospora sp. NPDC096147]|uniref:hypothetical protein n=1 Tax=Kitasatospora sp. NPDC096147 TaxID=3364093 RepID=UPI0037FA0DC3